MDFREKENQKINLTLYVGYLYCNCPSFRELCIEGHGISDDMQSDGEKSASFLLRPSCYEPFNLIIDDQFFRKSKSGFRSKIRASPDEVTLPRAQVAKV